MRADAHAYVPQTGGGKAMLRLALLGDSITESWRGTSMCYTIERANGLDSVLRETLGALCGAPPLALGLSGDQTQHLLWRLQNGELSPAMRADPSLVYVLLIGTNNLPRRHSPAAVASGILAVSKYILASTSGRLLINAVLPRADGDRHAPIFRPEKPSRLYNPQKASSRQRGSAAGGWTRRRLTSPEGSSLASSLALAAPSNSGGRRSTGSKRRTPTSVGIYNASFLPLIDQINHAVKEAVNSLSGGALRLGDQIGTLASAFPGRVAYIDCSAPFLPPVTARLDGKPAVLRELMPDLLHPNLAGHRLWAACIEQGLRTAGWLGGETEWMPDLVPLNAAGHR
jgi:lysophospholipase L1-like esterase